MDVPRSTGVLNRWASYRRTRRMRRQREAEMLVLIERMVQERVPSVRTVSGYRLRLLKPVERALTHMESLVAVIPGPVTLCAAQWDKDPCIHALFSTPQEIRAFLRNSPELRVFFQKSGSPQASVLLTATKKERLIFGTALEGDLIRRDVPQSAVEFYSHRVVAPAPSLEQNRRELIHQGLSALAAHALQQMLELRSYKEELDAQRQMVALKMRIDETRDQGPGRLLAGHPEPDVGRGQAELLLAQIDKRILELGPDPGTPHAILRKMEAVLENAGDTLTGKMVRLHLDWMGVKLSPASPAKGPPVDLAELEISGARKRAAVLATIPAAECREA